MATLFDFAPLTVLFSKQFVSDLRLIYDLRETFNDEGFVKEYAKSKAG